MIVPLTLTVQAADQSTLLLLRDKPKPEKCVRRRSAIKLDEIRALKKHPPQVHHWPAGIGVVEFLEIKKIRIYNLVRHLWLRGVMMAVVRW